MSEKRRSRRTTNRPASSDSPAVDDDPGNWTATAKKYLVIAGVGLVGILIAAAVIPRWWAQRLGGAVDGSITAGSLLGVVQGFICTVVPILLIAAAIRRRAWGATLLVYLVPALVFAFPLLATLWISVGTGSGAHAGSRTLDVEAPGVRGGSLVGFLLGVAAGGGIEYLLWSRRGALRDRATRRATGRGGDEEPLPDDE